MTAYVGRDVSVEFAIALPTANPAGLVYQMLGMMRAKDLKATWDSVDTTADKSPQYTRTSLVTFKAVEFSGDGVSYDDAVYNQLNFEKHAVNPPASTNNQPMVWLRITYPNKVYAGPFVVAEFSNSTPFDGEATWSISAKSNGAINLTPL